MIQRANKHPLARMLTKPILYISFTHLFSAITLPLLAPVGLNFKVTLALEFAFLLLLFLRISLVRTLLQGPVSLFLTLTMALVLVSLATKPENWFQIIRLGIGPVITAICLAVIAQQGPTLNIANKRLFELLIIFAGVLAFLPPLPFLPQNISINIIDPYSEQSRKFITPHTFFLIITPYLLLNRRPIIALAGLAIALASGSRGSFLAIIVTTSIFVLIDKRTNKAVVLLALGLMLLFVAQFFATTFHRLTIQGFVEDQQRITELLSALMKAIEFPNIIFGLPFTYPHWDGYFAVSTFDPERERVFINSMFDVHNGFVFLLLRFGIIGCALLALMIRRVWIKYPDFRPIVACYLLLWFTSSGPIMVIDGSFALILAFMLFGARASSKKDAHTRNGDSEMRAT